MAAQEPHPVELTWDAPPSCPQLDDVEEQIRMLISGVADGPWQSSMRARGTILPSSQRFELTLVIQQGQATGRRVIASDDCDSLGKAAAVVLGLLIRKERMGRGLSEQEISGDTEQPAQQGAPVATAVLPPSNPLPEVPRSGANPPTTPEPSTPAPRQSRSSIVVAPSLVLETGTLPQASYGTGLGAGVLVGGWRAFATGNLWLSQSTRPFKDHVFEATFRRRSAELTGCYAWSSFQVFEAGPCVQLAFDWVSARASGGRLVPKSEGSLLFSVGAGLGAFWHFGASTSFMAMATGRVATHRPTFVLETPFRTDGVHVVPALSAAMSLGFVWIF